MSAPSFKMPDGVVVDESTYSNNYGKYTVQPLERGFGVTLGNSFRRVLLSSLTGAAITGIRIDGVLHEFTTIEGVHEDITHLILNLKQVRIKMGNKKPTQAELTIIGPGEFKASDIQKHCPDVEILNPDLTIAHLSEQAKLTIELRFGTGRGYVPSKEQKFADQTIGLIPIDSIFTPITNVRYNIENVRIGDKNDYEKLDLEIFTDGSITPEEALSGAGKILKDHVNMFINFDMEPEEEKVESEKDAEFERIRKILSTNVDDLELSVRSHNCLKAANIKILGDLVRKDESEMLKFRNFGRKSLAELIEIVDNYGLEFGMDVDRYLKDNQESN
ncbi:MAG: DNA-directed RNA polymerase subunit alpha [Melioribacteraceae bacterium]|nr:DNA-directed RNA polymerase subunit alpha [Melioribacteraceae bacterium]MCF8264609.1 DNA-directed RNA polymerase subunit alpha [Melioribacteraceae bacterium]MCF8414456.1 DNA-directed RNA polymerase subunit alpha [Melioribacteraceae bacterium]